jgi:hypothetical protein
MIETRHTPIAFFIGTLLIFVYLLIAAPIGGPPDALGANMFSTLFRYGLNADTIATIALRSTLVFLLGFSITWLLLSLRK